MHSSSRPSSSASPLNEKASLTAEAARASLNEIYRHEAIRRAKASFRTTKKCCTAQERATLAILLWAQIKSGGLIRFRSSPFAIARTLRRLERLGAVARSPGAPSGFVTTEPHAHDDFQSLFRKACPQWAPFKVAEKGGVL